MKTKYEKDDIMAQETKCLTSGAQFHIHIRSDIDAISVEVDLPTDTLEGVDEEEAELLSRLIHNQLELVLRPYFVKRKAESGLFADLCMKIFHDDETRAKLKLV